MSFQSSQQQNGAGGSSNRPRLSESRTNASQIITALRSALPNSNQQNQQNGTRANVLSNAVPTSFLQNARTNRLSEYMSMLSIPNLSTNSLTLSNRGGAQSHTSASHVAVPTTGASASVHPSFRSKAVCALGCRFCRKDICGRGMKAILLSDTRVELYSTDVVPPNRVQLVGDDYMTNNCQCRIRDVACLGCGNVCGYHVTQPCSDCLSACNNGHFWMFHDDAVQASERTDKTGQRPLLWAQISKVDDSERREREVVCR